MTNPNEIRDLFAEIRAALKDAKVALLPHKEDEAHPPDKYQDLHIRRIEREMQTYDRRLEALLTDWTAVEEALPEEGDYVLCFDNDNGRLLDARYEFGKKGVGFYHENYFDGYKMRTYPTWWRHPGSPPPSLDADENED